MFRKLVSNLPFSPSLINQLGFYSKRLKKERATRKIGLILSILAIVAQGFTIIAPAKASLAASAANIAYDADTPQQVINAYFNGDKLGRNVSTIFNAFGINNSNIRNYKLETIYSSNANNYWTTGRSPRGYGEYPLQINSKTRIYVRTLSGWGVKNWQVMRYETAQGTRWILLGCGNVTFQPPVETPKVPDVKAEKLVDNATPQKDQVFNYTLRISNIGEGTATGVGVSDTAPESVEFVGPTTGTNPVTNPRKWQTSTPFNLAPGQTVDFTLQARATVGGPITITNKVCAQGNNGDSNGNNNCATVPVNPKEMCTVPGKENLPKDSPDCVSPNPNIKIEKNVNQEKYKVGEKIDYTLVVTNTGNVDLTDAIITDKAPEELEFISATKVNGNDYTDLSDKRVYTSEKFNLAKGKSITVRLKANVLKAGANIINQACVSSGNLNTCDDVPVEVVELCPTNPALEKDSPECQPACAVPGKENLPVNSPECIPCDETKTAEDGSDISCLVLSKKARNITQQVADANGTTANAGDTIEYTLSVTNQSKLPREGFVIEENISDIMEYADVLDVSGAKQTNSPVAMLTWEPADIGVNQTITRTFLIKIKSPIPSTPAAANDPDSYDMKVANVYGNTVIINLPKTPIKIVEETVHVLPSTGIGTNIAISTTLLMGASYFFFRSKLMVKELGLVRKEFNYGAGA